MATKQHPKNRHHCYHLEDCRALLEQMGFHMSEAHSFEDDNEVVVLSTETTQMPLAKKPSGEVCLNKRTEVLTVTNRTIPSDVGYTTLDGEV